MVAITYDFIKRLEQAGFTPVQVEVLSSFADTTANKPEIIQVEKELTQQIERAETRLEKRIDKLDERMDRLEVRMDRLDEKINKVEEKMEKGFENINSRMRWLIGLSISLVPIIPIITTWFSHFSR
jgi:peptidoglycan hydrolase CwlO-like protein